MTTVFIAGSISIKNLHQKVRERIGKIVASQFNVVVGDASGADTSIQKCLHKSGAHNVTVYCTGREPRNNVAKWPVFQVESDASEGSRAFYTAKDLEMARNSDYGLMIWDCKSTGTLSNVIELLKERKKSAVFVNKMTDFVTVSDRQGLAHLLTFMSEHARRKAEEKIGLSSKIAGLAQDQLSLDVSNSDSQADKLKLSGDEDKSRSERSFESENMKLRMALVTALTEHITHAQLSQSQAAKVLGVSQPRISDLTRGKIELFGLDSLVNMAEMAGLSVEMQVFKRLHSFHRV